MLNRLREDIDTILKKDPASRNWLEVLLCYPSLKSMWFHHRANWCWNHHLSLIARIISQFSRWLTGIEIHPGAMIGRRLFIDHGSGVVIGETTWIEDDVLIYSSVVLGGYAFEKRVRHPYISSNVVIGCGAKIIGSVWIPPNTLIKANSVVTK